MRESWELGLPRDISAVIVHMPVEIQTVEGQNAKDSLKSRCFPNALFFFNAKLFFIPNTSTVLFGLTHKTNIQNVY